MAQLDIHCLAQLVLEVPVVLVALEVLPDLHLHRILMFLSIPEDLLVPVLPSFLGILYFRFLLAFLQVLHFLLVLCILRDLFLPKGLDFPLDLEVLDVLCFLDLPKVLYLLVLL